MTWRSEEADGLALEPRIVSRSTTCISPWVDLIARSVDFGQAGGARDLIMR
jgi:hypothetical protein